MWFDGIRQPNTLYIAQTSRGKDSTAMLRAIELMGWPLDMICAVDIWATQDIPAELPPMVAFKEDYDRKVLEWFGIPVARLCATRENCTRISYSDMFYSKLGRGKFTGTIKGFPLVRGSWCKHLKTSKVDLRGYVLSQASTEFSKLPQNEGQKINIVHYIGIAADEPARIAKHMPKKDKVLPLVQIGWDEDLCGIEAMYMDMLSPTYEGSTRDGCWFCHNQSIGQLRKLRKEYPDLWALLLKWDKDSPITFKPDGHTAHDFDKRFQLEDEGLISPDDKIFRWSMLNQELNYRWF